MIGCMQEKVGLLVAIQLLNQLSQSLIVTRPEYNGQRDSLSNEDCTWRGCGNYSAVCTGPRCCQCACNYGQTFMSAMNSCKSENEIARGCNFMASTSKATPWSFSLVTVTSTDSMLSGLHLYHCKSFGCTQTRNCSALQMQYENNGWKEFPSSNESRFDVQDGLLKLTGKECNRRRFEGLLLRFQLTCNLGPGFQENKVETSCMVVKIAGNYRFGDVPAIGMYCQRESTEVVISSHLSQSKVASLENLHSITTGTSLSQYQLNLLMSSVVSSTSALLPYETMLPAEVAKAPEVAHHQTIAAEKITPSCTQPCGGGGGGGERVLTNVSNNFTGGKSSVVTIFVEPNQGRSDKSDNMIHAKYLLLSSVVAAVAVFFVILLVILLLLLRRKQRKLQAKACRSNFPNVSNESQRDPAQRVSDDQSILMHCNLMTSDLSPLDAKQPLPKLAKLGNVHNNEAVDGNELARIEIPKFEMPNPFVGTAEEYDVPADPPFLQQRSLSLLYAKVDKSCESYSANDDDIYARVGSGVLEITKVSEDISAIYEEPEEAIL